MSPCVGTDPDDVVLAFKLRSDAWLAFEKALFDSNE
jgi:hypothetical protein